MSTTNQVNNALQNAPEIVSLQDLIETTANELAKALPEHMRGDRLVRIAKTCIQQTPELARCTPVSFVGALFTAAQLGIEPIAGRAYILPFNNNRKKPDGSWHTVKEAQFILGYKGVVSLFFNHEKAISLDWGVVRVGDEFDYEKGTNAYLTHKPAKDRGDVVGYWVMANLLNGGKPFHYMTRMECLEHGKKHSKSWVTKEYDAAQRKKVPCTPHFVGGWATDEEAMCLKTTLTQGAKIWPISIELQRALEADESVRDIRPGVTDILDLPDQVNWDAVESEVNEKTEKEIQKNA